MVRRRMSPSIRAHLTCPIYHSRDCRHSLLSMHERIVQSHQSQKGGDPVGTSGPHFSYVLGFDTKRRDEPRPLLHLPRQ